VVNAGDYRVESDQVMKMIKDLARPDAYARTPDRVDLVETHISWVFLAGDRVYKLKKSVDYGFLDFSTLEKRRFFCEEEIRLNQRLCPDVYLGVRSIVRKPDGGFALDEYEFPAGPPVEYAVEMKRMPHQGMMLEKLARDEVDIETIDRIAAILIDFYAGARTGEEVNRYGRVEFIKHYVDEDFWQTADFVGSAVADYRYDRIQEYSDDYLDRQADLFQRRVENGYIREGHGDLHMGNICLGDRVYIFDCIEFNESLRCLDVASDLSFLAMDLDFHGRPDLAERLIDTYAAESGDQGVREVLNFYKCYRACVRAKIHCFNHDRPSLSEDRRRESMVLARRYFKLAYEYAGGSRRPRLVVFFGLMGAGKTHWARRAGKLMGARVISSDRVRKQLAGLGDHSRLYVPFGQGLYTPEMSHKVYQAMHRTAQDQLDAGLDVVLDGSYMKERHRNDVLDLAEKVDAETTLILTTAPEVDIMARLKRREAGPTSLSDGRREIYQDQVRAFEPVGDRTSARVKTLDTGASLKQTERQLRDLLGKTP
jgi:aminoglycoside phosphotransferase family enzyme/predicted kinase